jgi:hypothetical protein
VLLSKTGNKTALPTQTRPIAVLPVAMKVLEKVIMPYVSADIWKDIGQYQQGFRVGVSGCHINLGKILARMKKDKEEEK